MGGPQGPAGHRRPGRDGGGDLRTALPGGDRALQHRADLQLRGAPGPADGFARRVHRHGVRGRQVAEGDRERAAPARRTAGPAAGGTGVRVRDRGAGGPRPPAQQEPAVLRLQGRQRHPAAGPAEADRHGSGPADGRRRVRDLRHGGLPGARGGGAGPLGGLGPVHGGAHPGGADLRLPGLHERVRGLAAGPGAHRGLRPVRVLLPAARAGDRPGSGAAVRLRAGDGGPADGCAAGGGRAPDGAAAAAAVDPVRAGTAGARHPVVRRRGRGGGVPAGRAGDPAPRLGAPEPGGGGGSRAAPLPSPGGSAGAGAAARVCRGRPGPGVPRPPR